VNVALGSTNSCSVVGNGQIATKAHGLLVVCRSIFNGISRVVGNLYTVQELFLSSSTSVLRIGSSNHQSSYNFATAFAISQTRNPEVNTFGIFSIGLAQGVDVNMLNECFVVVDCSAKVFLGIDGIKHL